MKDKEKQYISMKEMLTKTSFEPITNCNCKIESRIENKDGTFVNLLNEEQTELQKEIEAMQYFANKNAVSILDIVNTCSVEKQIEEMEMAREIHKALLYCKNNSRCRNCEFKNDTPMSFCKAEYIAKVISEKYQPKLPEDSVVLSREEAERFRGQTINIAKVKSQERKEMAEKIYRKLQGHRTTYVKKWIEKKFGVEIKE